MFYSHSILDWTGSEWQTVVAHITTMGASLSAAQSHVAKMRAVIIREVVRVEIPTDGIKILNSKFAGLAPWGILKDQDDTQSRTIS